MKIIYAVVAVIMGTVSWIFTQTVWEYQYIFEYIFMFLASWFLCLVFLYQEENESSKKYTLITPSNIIYLVIVIVLLIILRNYELKYWATSTYSFYKLVVTVNLIQGIFIMIFYKIRDWYHHM